MGKIRFEILAERYFQGNLKDNEYKELVKLLNEKGNSQRLGELKKEWESNPIEGLQTKVNWKRLSYKINTGKQDKEVKLKSLKKWLQVGSVAAILLLGVIVGSLIEWEQFPGKSLEKQELVFETPRGDKSKIILPDGTEVWLNASSKLVYNPSNRKERFVELEGEALFKVTSNKKIPFIVHTNECDVRVLGTTFNVMAYDDFGRKEITLLEGHVNIEGKNLNESLKPGEAFILKDNKYQIVEGNTTQASSWVENNFNFKKIPVSELVKRLENWYDVDIELVNNSVEDANFTGTFKNEETIWQVLDALKGYIELDYERVESRKIKVMVY